LRFARIKSAITDSKTDASDSEMKLLFNASLLTFLTFAAFSYPFSVLPLSILFVFVLAVSASFSKQVMASRLYYFFVIPLCVGCAIYGSYNILSKAKEYKNWKTIQTMSDVGLNKEVIKDYRNLYSKMSHNKYFLYEYANHLSDSGSYIESNCIFGQYLLYGSDPMVYSCVGNNFLKMKKYAQAEYFYRKAAATVPNRYYPLSLLLKLYQETGDVKKLIDTAELIQAKPVKTPSAMIDAIKKETMLIILKKDSLLLHDISDEKGE